ncbi:MAG: DUF1800 family protein [Pseudomonadota bacterium]
MTVFFRSLLVLCILEAAGCGGSGIDGVDEENNIFVSEPDEIFATQNSTARFLTQATFGPIPDQVVAMTGGNASDWIINEFSQPASLVLPEMESFYDFFNDDELSGFASSISTFAYWRNVLAGDDQLRQRMAYALSQILVVSNGGGELLTDVPEAVGYYMDVLTRNAFGNYRDLMHEVTYTPAMGHYLTYLGNQKGDPATGRVPDENYAREILQLFTVGTVALNPDGTPKTDASDAPVEIYSNSDITGLARVFTGLGLSEESFGTNEEDDIATLMAQPMAIFEQEHSSLEKRFLGSVIPANTSAAESINRALDVIFNHSNVAPFVSRQLIQRFVTSHPEPAYVARVANAFEAGTYTLPNGTTVGNARRGDLKATISAILFDEQARTVQSSPFFGKVREPVLRFSAWTRAFQVSQITPQYVTALWDTSGVNSLNQHPYRAASVFNFYRPGYIAPGTASGTLELTVPELQIVNAASIPGYANFMTYMVYGRDPVEEAQELAEEFDEAGVSLDPQAALSSFIPDYQDELDVAADAAALLALLDQKLTYGTLSAKTRTAITEALNNIPLDQDDAEFDRVAVAIVMVVTSADFLVQR